MFFSQRWAPRHLCMNESISIDCIIPSVLHHSSSLNVKLTSLMYASIYISVYWLEVFIVLQEIRHHTFRACHTQVKTYRSSQNSKCWQHKNGLIHHNIQKYQSLPLTWIWTTIIKITSYNVKIWQAFMGL